MELSVCPLRVSDFALRRGDLEHLKECFHGPEKFWDEHNG